MHHAAAPPSSRSAHSAATPLPRAAWRCAESPARASPACTGWRCPGRHGVYSGLRAGTTCPLSFSLLYSPPESIFAVENGQKTTVADPAADMWALGVISYELLTARRVFPRSLTAEEVRDQITGRAPLPWETSEFKRRNIPELRMLRRTVMSCLSRDPLKRPTSNELLQSWNSLFDHATKGTVTQEMESEAAGTQSSMS